MTTPYTQEQITSIAVLPEGAVPMRFIPASSLPPLSEELAGREAVDVSESLKPKYALLTGRPFLPRYSEWVAGYFPHMDRGQSWGSLRDRKGWFPCRLVAKGWQAQFGSHRASLHERVAPLAWTRLSLCDDRDLRRVGGLPA